VITGNDIRSFIPLAEGLDHPECVAWDPDAGVLYAGGEAGQIYAIDEDGDVRQVAETGGFVLGLALDGAGRVYACAGERVVRVVPWDGSVEVYSAGTDDEPMRQPNFPAFAADGALFVTDSGTWDGDDGLVYRVLPGGHAEVWTRALPAFPNGCCLAPDGDALLVVQSTDPGVWRVPIGRDGSAGAPQAVCAVPGTVPDGIALDTEGRLYVACYRPDRICRVAPDGVVEVLADDPRGTDLAAPTNVAFIGEGLYRLAVANLAGWHIAVGDVGAAGHPLERPSLDGGPIGQAP
jgi:gluconolactonase